MSKRAIAALAALGLAAFLAGGAVALADGADDQVAPSPSSEVVALSDAGTPSATMTPSPSVDDDVSPSDAPSHTPSATASATPDDDGTPDQGHGDVGDDGAVSGTGPHDRGDDHGPDDGDGHDDHGHDEGHGGGGGHRSDDSGHDDSGHDGSGHVGSDDD